MLIAGGPGVASLQDYSEIHVAKRFQAQSQQGDTLDSLRLTLWDRLNTSTLVCEDDVVALDETDPNGWPTVNLLVNPSFEGTYSAGVAPSWATSSNSTGGTATPTADTNSFYGSTAQKLTFSNLANGTNGAYFNLYQRVKLPADENNVTRIGQPYYFSCYYKIVTAFVSAQLAVAIDWFNGSGGYIGQSYFTVLTNPGTTGWRRAFYGGYAPAGAYFGQGYLQYNSTAATNSGAFLLDAAQFEYATFGAARVPVNNPAMPLNPNFTGVVGSGNTATNWTQDGGATGVTYSIVSAPAIAGTAQQIALAGIAGSGTTRAVAQHITLPNALWSYTLTLTYQVTGALSPNARVRIGTNWGDINAGYLWNNSVDTANGPGVSNGWQTLTMSIGPQYGSMPTTPIYDLKIYAGIIDSADASVNGTVVLGAINVVAWPGNPDTATALVAQKYPTPYCDNTRPGCYTDLGRSGLYYRQLRVFGGYIKTIDTDLSASPEPTRRIQAVEYGTLLAEAPCTLNVSQQSDVNAIAAAVTYAQNLGYLVGLDTTTFVSGVGVIDAQSFTMSTFRDLMNYVANQTIAAYYVDYYCRLHYGSALSVSAPFNLSDAPDMATTFPYSAFVTTQDSTQAITEPVIEGGPQTSAPQTYTASGVSTTLNAALTSGTAYTSLSVNGAAVTVNIPSGTILTIGIGSGTTQQVTTSAAVSIHALSIPVVSFTANANYATGVSVAIGNLFSIYNGNAVQFVDSVNAAGVAQVVGLQSNDTLGANGITAVYAPDTGSVQLLTALDVTQSISVTFRFAGPVLVRLHQTSASSAGGSIGRKIFVHSQHSAIRSKQSAIDRANADLRLYAKAQKVATLVVTHPSTPLRAGLAIEVTNQTVGWSQQLLQVQQVTTSLLANGVMIQTLQLGYYRPDAIVLLAQARRASATVNSQLSGDSILQDALSAEDGWAITDSVTYTVSNVGVWGTAAWNGSTVWN